MRGGTGVTTQDPVFRTTCSERPSMSKASRNLPKTLCPSPARLATLALWHSPSSLVRARSCTRSRSLLLLRWTAPRGQHASVRLCSRESSGAKGGVSRAYGFTQINYLLRLRCMYILSICQCHIQPYKKESERDTHCTRVRRTAGPFTSRRDIHSIRLYAHYI